MNKIKIQEDVIYNKYVGKDIKIIHLADIHFNTNTNKETLRLLSNCIKQEEADYIIITGDIIDNGDITSNKQKIKELVLFFEEIANSNKVIISLGNHDIKTDCKVFFAKLNQIRNIYVLDNNIYQNNDIFITGFTLPSEYFYNKTGDELEAIFTNFLLKNVSLIKNLPKDKMKIALIHSPLKITNKEILIKLQEYDMILCGHTHDGVVPNFLKVFFGKNRGIVSPYKKLFPKFARGRVNLRVDDKIITMIITGGVTKLSLTSAKWLSKFNFVYDIGVNRIIIKKKEV